MADDGHVRAIRTSRGGFDMSVVVCNRSVVAAARIAAAVCVVACLLQSGCNRSSRANLSNDSAQRLSEARSLASRGQSAIRSGSYDQAIGLFEQSLSLAPDFGAAWHELGMAYMQRGRETDWIAAQQAFQRAAGLLPSDPTPYRNLGILYQQRGFEEDALRNFEAALVVDPNDLDSLRGAALSGKLLRRSDQSALDRLRRAQMIETDPMWRDLITRERIRVENDIDERLKG
jgi:tetratricopeptide (TPR) repeat protein